MNKPPGGSEPGPCGGARRARARHTPGTQDARTAHPAAYGAGMSSPPAPPHDPGPPHDPSPRQDPAPAPRQDPAPRQTAPAPRQTAPDPRRALGRRGEDLALAHLQALGATLVARNHRTRAGEIDLIVRDRRALVFVEVKTRRIRAPAGGPSPLRSGPAAAEPLQGLRHAQRRRLRRLAVAWLAEQATPPRAAELRFDAIGILLDQRDELVRLDHLEGAL